MALWLHSWIHRKWIERERERRMVRCCPRAVYFNRIVSHIHTERATQSPICLDSIGCALCADVEGQREPNFSATRNNVRRTRALQLGHIKWNQETILFGKLRLVIYHRHRHTERNHRRMAADKVCRAVFIIIIARDFMDIFIPYFILILEPNFKLHQRQSIKLWNRKWWWPNDVGWLASKHSFSANKNEWTPHWVSNNSAVANYPYL